MIDMNKGILKNTKAGWFVLYQVMRDELTSGYDSIPLHPDSQTWMDGYNLYEGREVDFEVRVYPSGTRYAKTIEDSNLGCSYPDCICQGDEITDCENRTPKQRQTMSKAQTPDQVVLGYKTALVEGGFHQGLGKTAVQQLIDEIVEHLTYDDDLTDDNRTTLETIRLRSLGKLSVEKDQIINTFKDAQVLHAIDDQMRGEQYYNQIYGK
jgi:DNA primase